MKISNARKIVAVFLFVLIYNSAIQHALKSLFCTYSPTAGNFFLEGSNYFLKTPLVSGSTEN